MFNKLLLINYKKGIIDPIKKLSERIFYFPESLGDFESTGDTSHDYFTSTLDGDPVVLTFDNFTINSGHTVTTTNRCKGLYLYIKGDLTINGTLSMSAKGAKAAGRYVITDWDRENRRVIFLNPNTDGVTANNILMYYGKYQVIYPIGGVGSTTANNPGVNGACGAGGFSMTISTGTSGTMNYYAPKYVRGGSGSSFCGGAGAGGGIITSTGSRKPTIIGDPGSDNGGAGGKGACDGDYDNPISARGTYGGGGAGIPPGKPYTNNNYGIGTYGAGGLLILIVDGNVNINGSIKSIGSNGGDGYSGINTHSGYGGAGSGGGAVHIFYNSELLGQNNISVSGGSGGSGSIANREGQSGGNGYINIVSIRKYDFSVVGTWIDGKPIYRLFFNPEDQYINLDLDIRSLNIDSLVTNYGSLNINYEKYPAQTFDFRIWDKLDESFHSQINISGTNINKDKIMIMEYTKTTDKINSCDSEENIYSLEETRIGTWIDGKPLYRKVIFANPPTVDKATVTTDISDLLIDNVIRLEGINYWSNNTKMTINCGTYIKIWVSRTNNTLCIVAITGYLNAVRIPCILEYTKTTDSIEDNFIPSPYSLEEKPLDFSFNGKQVYQKLVFLPSLTVLNDPKLIDVLDLNIQDLIYLDGIASHVKYFYSINFDNNTTNTVSSNTNAILSTSLYNNRYIKHTTINKDSYLNNENVFAILKYTKKDITEYYTNPVIGICKIHNGNRGGSWIYTDEYGNEVYVDKNYFNNHPIFSALTDVVIDGQHMVRHKKFYYKVLQRSEEQGGGFARIISPTPKEGFTLAPSFIYNGKEIDEWYCAKYQTVADDNDIPSSLPDRVPLVNLNIDDIRTKIQNRSSDEYKFDLWNIYQVAEIQLLMLFEYATANINSIIGNGAYGHSTDTAPFKVDDPEVAIATYRNHVGLWGNVWQHVYGIYSNTFTSTYYLLDPQDSILKNTGVSVPVHSAINYPVNLNTNISSFNPYYTFLTLPSSLNTDINVSTIPNAFYGKEASPSYIRSDCLFGGTVKMNLGTVGPFVLYFTQSNTIVGSHQGSRMSCILKVDENKPIGKWIDNKNIYRYNISLDDSNINGRHDISDLKIENMVSLSGSLELNETYTIAAATRFYRVILGTDTNTTPNVLQINVDSSNSNKNSICVLEYTMLNDTESTYEGDNIYSLEETRIGTWIDGKPLYRKVIPNITIPPAIGTWYDTNISDLNIERVIRLDGFCNWNNGSQTPIECDYRSAIWYYYNGNTRTKFNVSNWLGAIESIYGIIEYTKSTDSIDSDSEIKPYSLKETKLDYTYKDKDVYQKVVILDSGDGLTLGVPKFYDVSDLDIEDVLEIYGRHYTTKDRTGNPYDSEGNLNYSQILSDSTVQVSKSLNLTDDNTQLRLILNQQNILHFNFGFAILKYTKKVYKTIENQINNLYRTEDINLNIEPDDQYHTWTAPANGTVVCTIPYSDTKINMVCEVAELVVVDDETISVPVLTSTGEGSLGTMVSRNSFLAQKNHTYSFKLTANSNTTIIFSPYKQG